MRENNYDDSGAQDDMDRRDAQRWRALMASQRMHWIGSAGFTMVKKDPDGPDNKKTNIVATPREGESMHFGMEFWSVHAAHGNPDYSDAFERQLLTTYVDEMIKRGVM